MLRTSLVLCTYNGQAYLGELLRSVLDQESEIDEIIVSDDASRDATVELVVGTLAPVAHKLTLIRNAQRAGAVQNFSRALRLARGAIVLLADQDDVWHATKVGRVVSALAEAPSACEAPLAVYHDARLVGADGVPLGGTLAKVLKARVASGHSLFLQLLKRNLVPGCTLAVRRELLRAALPVPDGFVHDEWLVLCAAASERLARIDDALIDYRIHPGNHLGLRGLGMSARVAAASRAGEVRRERLDKLTAVKKWTEESSARSTRVNQTYLEQAIAHWTTRGQLPAEFVARTRCVLREFRKGHYSLFASGPLSAVRDLIDPRS